MSVVIVKTEEEVKARTRHDRRENERRKRDGLDPKAPVEYRVADKHNKPKPKKKAPAQKAKRKEPPAQQPIKLADTKGLSKKEREVLAKTLIKSVEIIDEGKLVDSPTKVKDTSPADISEAKLKERRRKARERREKLKN